METKLQVIEINGVKYVPQGQERAKVDGEYKIVRTYSAGVFAGVLKNRSADGKRGEVHNARRLWYWEGAASLSQLAEDGTSKPDGCKFPVEVSKVELTEIIEVLDVTEKARASIAGVPVWRA